MITGITVYIVLATAVITLITAVIGAIYAYMARQAVHQVSIQVDGRLTQLLELTEKAAHAAGIVEGKDESDRRASD